MHDTASLVSRIERLELENRRWRRAATAAALGLLAAVAAGMARPRSEANGTLEGRELVLKDDAGREYASLRLDPKGLPLFAMIAGDSQAALTMSGPALYLRAPDRKRSAFLGIDARGENRLELTGPNVTDGVRAAVSENGSAGFFLLDGEGYDRATMEHHPGLGSQLSLRGPRSAVRSTFGLDEEGNASTVLMDPKGRRRIGMVVTAEGTPFLSMDDEDGRPRANLTMAFDGTPRLEMLREDGGASFEAP